MARDVGLAVALYIATCLSLALIVYRPKGKIRLTVEWIPKSSGGSEKETEK